MTIEYTEDDLVSRWGEFFTEDKRKIGYDYQMEILRVATLYPDVRSVYVDYHHINKFDGDLAEYLLENPQMAIWAAEKAIEETLPVDLAGRHLFFRLQGIEAQSDEFGIYKKRIRDIRRKCLGRIVVVEGLVRKRTETKQKITYAAHQCQRCGTLIRSLQDWNSTTIKEPIECDKDQGGCSKPANQTQFLLLLDQSQFTGSQGFTIDASKLSEYVDVQNIEIQELPEDLEPGQQPDPLPCLLMDDLCGTIEAGNKVQFTGILKSKLKEKGNSNSKLLVFDQYLQVLSIKQCERDSLDVTREEEIEIRNLARDPNIYDRMIATVAPHIHGRSIEKMAGILAIFGGASRKLKDGTQLRSSIHIGYPGDPSTGKSQIIRFLIRLSPRGQYISGKSANKNGMTATAEKDAESGKWTLTAGATVLADGGHVGCDELDKMDPADRAGLHTVMEDQILPINKAGMNLTLQTRCGIIAGMNPKTGAFDTDSPKTMAEQVDLPPSLLSRLDIILPMIDRVDPTEDSRIAKQIAINRWGDGEIQVTGEQTFEPIPVPLLRKYISLARKMNPKGSLESSALLAQTYLDFRTPPGESINENVKQLKITARQAEGICRLAEASARIRLSETVEPSDLQRAIDIYKCWITRMLNFAGSDEVIFGTAVSQNKRIVSTLQFISDRQRDQNKVTVLEVVQWFTSKNRGACRLDTKAVLDTLDRLYKEGTIWIKKDAEKPDDYATQFINPNKILPAEG
jgi:replicative DNA helicase Mcm